LKVTARQRLKFGPQKFQNKISTHQLKFTMKSGFDFVFNLLRELFFFWRLRFKSPDFGRLPGL
jgi:hypothetical protein